MIFIRKIINNPAPKKHTPILINAYKNLSNGTLLLKGLSNSEQIRINIDIAKINEIKNLKLGSYTKPITIPGGFLILKIKDIKKIKKEINIEEELNKIVREKKNQQLNQYSIIFYNKIKKDMIINEI